MPVPVLLGGRGKGLALSDSWSIFSMLAAERRPLDAVARLRTVGRISLIEGVWLGLEGEGQCWSLCETKKERILQQS